MSDPVILSLDATLDTAELRYAGVNPGDQVQVQVQVVRNGQVSGWSAAATADIAPLPGPPTLAVASSRVMVTGRLTPAVLRCKTLAERDGTYALLSVSGRRKSVTLWRANDTPVQTPLDDVSDADPMTNASLVLSGLDLFILSVGTRPAYAWYPDTRTRVFQPSNPPPMLRRYQINADDLTLKPVEAFFLGNDHTTASDLIVLADGSVFAVGYRVPEAWPSTYADSHMTLVYGRYDGETFDVRDGPQVDGSPGFTGQTALVAAQHPVDGRVWIFAKGDSFHRLGAILVDPATMEVVASYPEFVSSRDGDDNVEGEFPHLCAVTDPLRNRIVLAYQNCAWTRSSAVPPFGILDRNLFIKGAGVTVASVQVDGTRTFERIPDAFVERVWGLAVSVLSHGLLVAARYPLTLTAPYYLDVAVWRQAHGVWSGPVSVGRTNTLYEDVVLAERTLAMTSGSSVMTYELKA